MEDDNDWMRQAAESGTTSILEIVQTYPDTNGLRDKTFLRWALDHLSVVKCGAEAETKDVGRGFHESTGRVAVLILFERPKSFEAERHDKAAADARRAAEIWDQIRYPSPKPVAPSEPSGGSKAEPEPVRPSPGSLGGLPDPRGRRTIRVMRRWSNGDITSIGLFTTLYWALHAFRRAEQRGIWIEDEKKPATLKGHS